MRVELKPGVNVLCNFVSLVIIYYERLAQHLVVNSDKYKKKTETYSQSSTFKHLF